MKISHELTANALVIYLAGELDHHAAHDAIAYVSRQVSLNRGKQVELNLSGLTFMDSSGLAVAVNAKRATDRAGSAFAVRGAPAHAMKIFRAARLEKMMSFI